MNETTSGAVIAGKDREQVQICVVGLALENDNLFLCYLPSNTVEQYPFTDEGIVSAYQSIKKIGVSFLLMEELSPFHRTFAAFLIKSAIPAAVLSAQGRAKCPKPFGEGIGIGEMAARTLAYLAGEFLLDKVDLDLVDPEDLAKHFNQPLVRRPNWRLGPDIVSEKVLSLEQEFLWIGIPKVATRSLLDTFVRKPEHDFDVVQVSDPLPQLLDRVPEADSFFTFAFVRNPWSRVVSAYLDKLTDPTDPRKLLPHHEYPGLYPGIEFEEFVRFLVEEPCGSDDFADRHWVSQHKFFEREDGSLQPVTIGKLETFDEDLEAIGEKLGIEGLNAPRKNVTDVNGGRVKRNTKPPTYYRSFYTARTRDMIGERYARDIELYDYTY